MRKLLSIVLAAVMVLGICTAAIAEEATELVTMERAETMYFAGNAWGAPSNFNQVSGNPSWPANGNRVVMFESLYMFNLLTGGQEPLLADGDIEWESDQVFNVKVKDAAHWNDGQPLTNEDVAYTYNIANKYALSWSNNWTYLEKVEAIDGNKVQFTLKEEPYDRIQVPASFTTVKIIPKHIWEAREEETGEDAEALRAFADLDSAVSSGPYMPYYYDDTRIAVVRDDNYWGADESMFGKLPAPKYLCHLIFADNAAGNLALKDGSLDVSQQFIPNVWELWEDDPAISTYLSENPYFIPGQLPSVVFNVTRPGLDDPIVRRAIAMCVDYEAVAMDAMCGMTGQIKPTLFLPSQEGLLNESEIIEDLTWDSTDIDYNREMAAEMLDEAGYIDADGDGLRDMPDGSAIEWKVECPYGWSDWNASLEIVASSAQEIGLNLVTNFPEWATWNNGMQTGDFDIVMNSPGGDPSPGSPWTNIRNVIYSKGIPDIGETAYTNMGRYRNDRVDELMDAIAGEKDDAKIMEMYTEIQEIYLEDMPTFPLMYRPWLFHTVSEHYWTGFPTEGDGTNIPPQNCTDGAGVRSLYIVEPVK